MNEISREITTFIAVALLSTQVIACARRDINLGERGGARAEAGTGGSQVGAGAGGLIGVDSGSGGAAASGGEVGAAAGGVGRGAGTGGSMAAGGTAVAGAGAAGDAGNSGPVAQPSSGCGMEAGIADTSIDVSGMRATYVTDLPTGYDKARAYPLVMGFRGLGVTAEAFRDYLYLMPVAGTDAIVVNANPLGDATTWDMQQDVLLFDALLTKLESRYCVDPNRVFAVGHGSGGLFASVLGCVRGDKLRGIAPLSGAGPMGSCVGETAVWITQGNADAMMLATGRASREFWIAHNKCSGSMFASVDPSPCVEYAGCDAGHAVRYCEYNGGLDLPSFAAAGLWGFFKSL